MATVQKPFVYLIPRNTDIRYRMDGEPASSSAGWRVVRDDVVEFRRMNLDKLSVHLTDPSGSVDVIQSDVPLDHDELRGKP